MGTLSDIAAEMRTRSREVKEAFGGRPDCVENMLDIWADRIEAAWKRQEKTYLDQIRDAMNMWGHEKHIAEHAQKPTVGNAAAMREALTNLTRYGESDIRQLEQLAKRAIDNDIYGGGILQSMCAAIREGKEALFAPARNCDRFATVKDAAMAFAHERRNAPHPCPDFTFSTWLMEHAAERKGEGDGR